MKNKPCKGFNDYLLRFDRAFIPKPLVKLKILHVLQTFISMKKAFCTYGTFFKNIFLHGKLLFAGDNNLNC